MFGQGWEILHRQICVALQVDTSRSNLHGLTQLSNEALNLTPRVSCMGHTRIWSDSRCFIHKFRNRITFRHSIYCTDYLQLSKYGNLWESNLFLCKDGTERVRVESLSSINWSASLIWLDGRRHSSPMVIAGAVILQETILASWGSSGHWETIHRSLAFMHTARNDSPCSELYHLPQLSTSLRHFCYRKEDLMTKTRSAIDEPCARGVTEIHEEACKCSDCHQDEVINAASSGWNKNLNESYLSWLSNAFRGFWTTEGHKQWQITMLQIFGLGN